MSNTRQIIRNVFGGIEAIPFLMALSAVFIISNELANGIVSGKYFWFYGSMGLVAVSTLLAGIVSKRNFRFSWLDGFVLLFTASVCLSACVFNDAPPNPTKLTVLILLPVWYFCLRIFLSTGIKNAGFRRSLLCLFIAATGLTEAVWGLLQLYGFEPSQHSLFKVTGSFFNPGPYSGYLAVVFPLALYNWLYAGKVEKNNLTVVVRWFSAVACIGVILILPAAMSRASWLAIVGGSFVLGLFYCLEHYPVKTYYSRHKKRFRIAFFAFLFLMVAAFSGMYFLKKDSADGRFLMWKVSLPVIKKHPFGVGLGNFPGAYGDAQAEYLMSDRASETEKYVAGNPEYAFNEYLQIGVESGIVALIFFFGILFLAFRALYRTKQWGVAGTLTAMLIFGCFSYPFSVLPFLVVFVFLLAMSDDPKKTTAGKRILPPAIASLCLLAVAVYLQKQYPVYKAYKEWNREQIYYHAGLYRDASETYEKLYPYLNDQVKFLFEYAQSLSKSGQYAESNEVLNRAMQISCDPMLYNIAGKNCQALKAYTEAEYYFVRSTQIVPNRLYPYYLLAKLYDEMGQQEKAREMAAIVLTKEPKVMSTAVKEMREEVGKLKIKH